MRSGSPSSRLPDFSFAGYHAGNKALPNVTIKTNVKDFGAKGDGTTDDTAAFKSAIAATSNGALYIPAGRYKITNLLTIDKSNVVLRGAGEGKTVLYMARSLQQILGTAPYGLQAACRRPRPGSGQSADTGHHAAARGDHTLVLASTAGIQAGQMIRLVMTNPPNNSLGCYLYADQGCLNAERQKWYANPVDWIVQVQAVQGNTVTLVRPLRVDVRLEWQPRILAASSHCPGGRH